MRQMQHSGIKKAAERPPEYHAGQTELEVSAPEGPADPEADPEHGAAEDADHHASARHAAFRRLEDICMVFGGNKSKGHRIYLAPSAGHVDHQSGHHHDKG